MPYKELWMFVEGNDDERFFQKIKSVLEKSCDCVHPPWKYRQKTKKRIRNFLDSVRSMNGSYFFLADINRSPCVTAKKSALRRNYGERLDRDNVVVVVKEIEGWYLAGLDDNSCKDLGIRPLASTDDVTKEHFNSMIPSKFDSRIDFMIEVLKRFSVKTAEQKNKSFAHFMKKISVT